MYTYRKVVNMKSNIINPMNRQVTYSKKLQRADGWCKSEKELGITFEGIDDDLETDYYLWLTGQAGKMLRKQIALQETQPKR